MRLPHVIVASLVLLTACSPAASPVRDRAVRVQTTPAPAVPDAAAGDPAEQVDAIASAAPAASPKTPSRAQPRAGSGADTPRQASESKPLAKCAQRPGAEQTPATPSGSVKPGAYTYVVSGTYDVKGERTASGEVPDRSTRVRGEPRSDAAGTRFTDERKGERGGSTTTHFLQTATELRLEKTVTTSRRGDREYVPTPPIVVARYPFAQDLQWESSGTDGTTTVTVRAKVLRTDSVEVCGSRYGVWVIESWTKIVNPQATIDTHSVTFASTQLGGLVLYGEHDTTTTAGANTLRTDTVETLHSIVPDAA